MNQVKKVKGGGRLNLLMMDPTDLSPELVGSTNAGVRIDIKFWRIVGDTESEVPSKNP